MGISSIPKDIWEALKRLFNTDGFDLWNKAEEFIDWIWDQLKTRIGDLAENVVNTILDALRAIWHAVTAPFHAIYNTLLHLFTNLYYAAEDIAGPLAPVLFISVAGIMAMGVFWVLKRLYELL